jgi:hypothetical protein
VSAVPPSGQIDTPLHPREGADREALRDLDRRRCGREARTRRGAVPSEDCKRFVSFSKSCPFWGKNLIN